MVIKRQMGKQGEWIFQEGLFPLQLRVVQARDINPQHHLHRQMYEYFYIIQGQLKITVAGKLIELLADDMLFVQPGEKHMVQEVSPDLKMLLIVPAPIADDKIIFFEEND